MTSVVKTYVTGDKLLLGDLNNEFAHIYSLLGSFGGANIVDGSITVDKLADGASVEVFFGEVFNDEIVISGLNKASDSALTLTLNSGTAYVLDTTASPSVLKRIVKATASTHVLAASSTNYIHLKSNGQFLVNTSAAFTDSVTLWKAVTDGSSVTSDTDQRDLIFLEQLKVARKYVDNIEWEVNSNTAIVIQAGGHWRDTNNDRSYTFAANITVDIGNSLGALGLDQGTESSSTWYALVGLGDSSGVLAPSVMLVDATDYSGSIVLPTGYDDFRRIGWVRNDGSSNFIQGEYLDGRFHYDDAQQVLTAGTSSSFAGVSCAAFVPPNIRSGLLYGTIQTTIGSGSAQWRTTGNSASSGKEWAGFGSEASGYGGIFLLDSSQSIDYKAAGSETPTFDIWVDGWADNLQKDS